MRNSIFWICLVSLAFGCEPDDEVMPKHCEIHQTYYWSSQETFATEVYDVSKEPLIRIKNGSLEFIVANNLIVNAVLKEGNVSKDEDIYFIESIEFSSPGNCEIRSSENDWIYNFKYDTVGCDIELYSNKYNFYGELKNQGKEMELQRYAVWRYSRTKEGKDTFLFSINVDPKIGSEKDVAKYLQIQYPDAYDTVAIDRIVHVMKL